jgi:hypothetical protein
MARCQKTYMPLCHRRIFHERKNSHGKLLRIIHLIYLARSTEIPSTFELSDLYKLNPVPKASFLSLYQVSGIHVVESTEATILAAESNDNPAKQITVSGLSTQIQFTAYNQDIDNSLIEKHDMVTGDLLMMGYRVPTA